MLKPFVPEKQEGKTDYQVQSNAKSRNVRADGVAFFCGSSEDGELPRPDEDVVEDEEGGLLGAGR